MVRPRTSLAGRCRPPRTGWPTAAACSWNVPRGCCWCPTPRARCGQGRRTFGPTRRDPACAAQWLRRETRAWIRRRWFCYRVRGRGATGGDDACSPMAMTRCLPSPAVDGARHPVLESLWGVLVLSVRGLASDAGRMGGGDFDGDDALVIWEPELVGKVEAGGEGKQGSGEEEEEGGEERDGPSGQLAALEAQLEGTPAPTRPEPACASDDDSGPAACFEAWRQSFSHNELGRVRGHRRREASLCHSRVPDLCLCPWPLHPPAHALAPGDRRRRGRRRGLCTRGTTRRTHSREACPLTH